MSIEKLHFSRIPDFAPRILGAHYLYYYTSTTQLYTVKQKTRVNTNSRHFIGLTSIENRIKEERDEESETHK